jgi:uncharacterized protein
MDDMHQQQLEVASKLICQKIKDVIVILLFGSYGTDFEKSDSDLDLALLADSKIDALVLWELAQEIAIKLNRDVDLIDLRQASTVFRFQILNSCEVIYCSDPKAFASFENTSISMYLHFQETRKEILSDYGAGGGSDG